MRGILYQQNLCVHDFNNFVAILQKEKNAKKARVSWNHLLLKDKVGGQGRPWSDKKITNKMNPVN